MFRVKLTFFERKYSLELLDLSILFVESRLVLIEGSLTAAPTLKVVLQCLDFLFFLVDHAGQFFELRSVDSAAEFFTEHPILIL